MSVITTDPNLTPRLREVLADYRLARHEMRMFLGVDSAGAVVDGMHRGAWPRRGSLPDGLRYIVHGIGYTVVMPSGGLVHLDAADGGDSLTVSELAMSFRTLDDDPPTPEELEQALTQIAREGGLHRLGSGKYLLP